MKPTKGKTETAH